MRGMIAAWRVGFFGEAGHRVCWQIWRRKTPLSRGYRGSRQRSFANRLNIDRRLVHGKYPEQNYSCTSSDLSTILY